MKRHLELLFYMPAISILYSTVFYDSFFKQFPPLRSSFLTLADYLDKAASLLLVSFFTIFIFGLFLFILVTPFFSPPKEGAPKPSIAAKFFLKIPAKILAHLTFTLPMLYVYFFVPFGHPLAGGIIVFLVIGLGPLALIHTIYPKAFSTLQALRGVYIYLGIFFIFTTATIHAHYEAQQIQEKISSPTMKESELIDIFHNGILIAENGQLVFYDHQKRRLSSAKIKPLIKASQACLLGMRVFCPENYTPQQRNN